jgi:KDO2-lipid IV(A) lauroyltransferase
MKTRMRYHAEAMAVTLCYGLLRLLSIQTASAVGGFVARSIGPHLRRTHTARRNIKRTMPVLPEHATDKLIKNMWDNIGRTLAEFPHIGGLDAGDFANLVSFEGREYVEAASHCQRGSIYFTGHLANWEMAAKAFKMSGHPLSVVVRRGNNPGLEKIVQDLREGYRANLIPKGQSGARQMIQSLKNGERVGIFVDQKMNDGIKTSFFGLPAMTAPAIARLALKYNYPVFPTRTVRVDGPKHKVIVYPPISITRTGNTEQDVLNIMNNINLILEEWIREYPEQWFWIHNRWQEAESG